MFERKIMLTIQPVNHVYTKNNILKKEIGNPISFY